MILLLFLQIEWQTVNKPLSDSLQTLMFYYKIPHHDLKFFIKDSVFFAQYECQLKVYDKKGKQIAGDYWQRQVTNDSADIYDSISLIVPVASNSFNVKIIDINGGVIFNMSEKILTFKHLGGFGYAFNNDTLNIRYSIFNKDSSFDSIAYALDAITQGKHLRVGIYDDSITFLTSALSNNSYDLKFRLFLGGEKIDEFSVPVKISRPFYLDESVWSSKVAQLEYIATPSEITKLKGALKTERDSLWREFWKPHDPTPNSEYNEKELEYFTRIEYCEKHFGHGDRGWRSDRAKIYVRYGPPDEIQSRPYELQYKPFEVWFYYRQNRKYYFVDEYGYGEYILINSQGTVI